MTWINEKRNLNTIFSLGWPFDTSIESDSLQGIHVYCYDIWITVTQTMHFSVAIMPSANLNSKLKYGGRGGGGGGGVGGGESYEMGDFNYF